MFTLPSLWNLIISTLVFFITAKYLHIYLESQGLAKGMVRGTLVFTVASLISCGSEDMVDWTQEKIGVSQPATQNADYMQQMLNIVASRVTTDTMVQDSK